MRIEGKIKFAVVGAGHIGKRHAEMIRREDEAELVALVDIRDHKECGIEEPDVPFFNSIEELLDSKKEDLLAIEMIHNLNSLNELKEKIEKYGLKHEY